jgi:two-component system, OmpR family, response regulator
VVLAKNTAASARVLVVEDEQYIGDVLVAGLSRAGFDARSVSTGATALAETESWHPDLLLLDVMLPDMTGYDVCRTLVGAGHDAGVIFLTARDEVADRIRGFGVGADDYVVKPFSLEEVIARVRAVLNRRSRGAGASADRLRLTYGDLVMDDERHRVTRGETDIHLSPTEYSLLRYLLSNPERVVSKTQILDHVWDYDFGGDGGIVETFISSLRRKLNAAGPPMIKTVRGFGYSLQLDP